MDKQRRYWLWECVESLHVPRASGLTEDEWDYLDGVCPTCGGKLRKVKVVPAQRLAEVEEALRQAEQRECVYQVLESTVWHRDPRCHSLHRVDTWYTPQAMPLTEAKGRACRLCALTPSPSEESE